MQAWESRLCYAQATLVAFVNWLSAQLRRPSNPTRSVPAAVGALASLLREKPVRQLFTRNGAAVLPVCHTCDLRKSSYSTQTMLRRSNRVASCCCSA